MAELPQRVVAFLSAGTRTGMLGFVASDGRPLVTPVWFVVDDGGAGVHHRTPHVRKALHCNVIHGS